MNKEEFVNYLTDVLEDVESVEGDDQEIRSQLIEIAQDVVETIECRLNIEEDE